MAKNSRRSKRATKQYENKVAKTLQGASAPLSRQDIATLANIPADQRLTTTLGKLKAQGRIDSSGERRLTVWHSKRWTKNDDVNLSAKTERDKAIQDNGWDVSSFKSALAQPVAVIITEWMDQKEEISKLQNAYKVSTSLLVSYRDLVEEYLAGHLSQNELRERLDQLC